ncbi:MAG: bifunctional diaminohydroxyphosphoribosylaminopyrimidine [Actinomycetota bacterium]|jgi:diaminohydroxyphosphoribosylaminopyrimidine deaminase/5-amino-6-(5-phosphoribosylamino)uracil reductase
MVVWVVAAHDFELNHLLQLVDAVSNAPVRTAPNPRVGCRIVSATGELISQGIHGESGVDHAEVIALKKAGEKSQGATAIVTLEPCNHVGKTGPCAQALIAAGISRVVFGSSDLTVARGGADALREAGIEVVSHQHETVCDELIAPWKYFNSTGLPYVTLKMAATLDGYVAASDGSSRWITGEEARTFVHQLRARVDAVAVGSGTVAIDDPLLDVRLPGDWPQPQRFIIGKRDLSSEFRITGLATQLRTHDPREALTEMAQQGVMHLLLEGGPTTAAAFVRAGLVNELYWCAAPKLLGAGTASMGDLGIHTISEASMWELTRSWVAGQDVISRFVPASSPR